MVATCGIRWGFAQRGPGLASRQRAILIDRRNPRAVPAQRGPGLASRQRARVDDLAWQATQHDAQRGPGLASRQRGAGAIFQVVAAFMALNEGRDSRPGNGLEAARALHRATSIAQRGPGLASRQRTLCSGVFPSGTAAAQRGPGLASRQRVARPFSPFSPVRLAQRGPGLASRQRLRDAWPLLTHVGARSTRAGTRVPATASSGRRRAPGRWPTLNEGRDSRPGNGATPAGSAAGAVPLNEGRDSRPGNGPAGEGAPVNKFRPAQRGPGLASRQRRPSSWCRTRGTGPLNEGRDSRPGNGPPDPE